MSSQARRQMKSMLFRTFLHRSESYPNESTTRSSRLHGEKQSFGKPTDLVASLELQIKRFVISKRVVALSATSKSARLPARAALDDAEPADDTVWAAPPSPLEKDRPGPVASTEHEGTKAASGSANAETDVKNGQEEELLPSDGVGAAPQWAIGPSALTVTEDGSGQSSGAGQCASSGLDPALSPSGGEQPGKRMPTAPRVAPADPPDDPFREPAQIPGCSPPTFVYPHSSAVIGAAFHERYREVVNIFRHNAKEHPRLRESLEYIDYTLKLCGTPSGDPRPSILVFCRHSEFKDLNSLLTSKELKYQYCLRRSGRRFPWSGNQASVIQEGYRPFFNLYFWRQRRPRTLYWGKERVQIHPPLGAPPPQRPAAPSRIVPGLTMCGSVVELHGRESSVSTLGCVMQIDSDFYAVTTMHAFRLSELTDKRLRREMSGYEALDQPSGDAAEDKAGVHPVRVEEPLCGSESDLSDAAGEDGDYLVDDVEYESLPEEEYDDEDDDEGELVLSDNRSAVASDPHGNDGTQADDDQVNEAKQMLALFPTPRELDESGELDLDWALIKLEDQQDWRPNAFVHPGVSSSPVFLSDVASQPAEERQVFIITGETTPQRGILQPGISMLGGINGRTPSTMWTVVLSEPNRKSATSPLFFLNPHVSFPWLTLMCRFEKGRLRLGCRRCRNQRHLRPCGWIEPHRRSLHQPLRGGLDTDPASVSRITTSDPGAAQHAGSSYRVLHRVGQGRERSRAP